MSNAITPPHSSEAEQSVLGAVLLDNAAFDAVADIIDAESFYQANHRGIWNTMKQLCMASKPADVLTVFEAGGHDMVYLNQLVSSVVTHKHARQYAELVRKHWTLRQLMRIGSDLADSALRGTPEASTPEQLVDAAVTALMALASGQAQGEPRLVADLMPEWIDDLTERYEREGTDAMGTGLADLDRATSDGGRHGELWVIGARPSMGKTAITLHLARNIAVDNVVLTLSQEDSLKMLLARHVASAGRVNLADVRSPKRAPDSMWAGVSEGAHHLSKLHLYVDDQTGLRVMDVRRKIQQVKRRAGRLDVVVVDYLQLMEGDGDNRNQQLGTVANGLNKAAKELGVWIILLSQLNRETDKRSGPPQMSDLRDSGDIEGAAHLIGLLHREAMRRKTDANKHHAELHIVKQKNGPTCVVNLYFDGATQRFDNWEGAPPRIDQTRHARTGMSE